MVISVICARSAKIVVIPRAEPPEETVMTTQLRRYDIADKAGLDRLVAWFPKLIPVREKYGFSVDWAFADYEHLQFIWSVSHDGDFDAAMVEYDPSPERAEAFAGFDNPITGMKVGFVDRVV